MSRCHYYAAVLALLTVLSPAAAPTTQQLQRAFAGLDALMGTFWSRENAYLMEEAPARSGPQREGLLGFWNYQESIHAMALGARLAPASRYAATLQQLVSAQQAQGGRQRGTGASGWQRQFYDDMNWAVLALIAAFDATAEPSYLRTARAIFHNITVAATRDCGGGVWWDTKHTEKATASNAGPALSGALLHARTPAGENVLPPSSYLAWAERVYAHWNRTMSDPQTGAVTDHIAVNMTAGTCAKVHWSFTYNEGLMLGAATALGASSNSSAAAAVYAADAARFAYHLVHKQTKGGVLFDACETRCSSCCDCQSFKGIAARELARWLQAQPAPAAPAPSVLPASSGPSSSARPLRDEVEALLGASAEAVWAGRSASPTSPSLPLFSAGWLQPVTCIANAAAHTSGTLALLSDAIVRQS